MPRPSNSRVPRPCGAGNLSRGARIAAVTVLVPLAFGACAPDAWKRSAPYDAFLDKVQRNCGTARIGELTVYQLLNPPLQSAYFIDATSQFASSRLSAEGYVLGVSTTFNTEPSSAGIRCVVAQKGL